MSKFIEQYKAYVTDYRVGLDQQATKVLKKYLPGIQEDLLQTRPGLYALRYLAPYDAGQLHPLTEGHLSSIIAYLWETDESSIEASVVHGGRDCKPMLRVRIRI